MDAKVLAVSRDIDMLNDSVSYRNTMFQMLDEMRLFGGRVAAICYTDQPWGEEPIFSDEASIKRAATCIRNRHHSTQQHSHITILLTGIPKILAMCLNSLGCYTTSERSGRFTKLSGDNKEESDLYNKWEEKLRAPLMAKYPDIGKKLDTVAQENARYMTSVFTHTALAYTTSLCQWNYILQWANDYYACTAGFSDFDCRLVPYMKELVDCLHPLVYTEGLTDYNRRSFPLLDDIGEVLDIPREMISDVYSVNYRHSFVALAQAHRHRTLDYRIHFTGKSEEFFVPYFIRGTEMAAEWLEDITSVAGNFPNGTLVTVSESGRVEHFILKCAERLCGAAQPEVRLQTEHTYQRFLQTGPDVFSHRAWSALQRFTLDGHVVARCIADSCLQCSGGCFYGPHKIFCL